MIQQTDEHHDYRGYAGQVATEHFVRDEVVAAVGHRRVARVETFDGEVEEGHPADVDLDAARDDIDISRGDMIRRTTSPRSRRSWRRWCAGCRTVRSMRQRRHVIKHTTRSGKALVDEVRYRIDVNTCIATRRRLHST